MQDLTWFPFSILATLCFGISMTFYKLPSTKNQSRFAVSFWQLFISLALSVLIFYNSIFEINWQTVLFGGLWGIAFLLLSLTQMKALKSLDTNMLFPVTSSLSLVLSVLAGLFFFKDGLSWVQLLGMALVVITVSLFSYKGKKFQYSKEVLLIGLSIILLSAFSKIVQKLAADSVNIQSMQIFQYFTASFLSFILLIFNQKNDLKKVLLSGTFKSGALIAIPSFIGGYSLIYALSKGPFALITSIHSTYILITAILAYFIFKEKLNLRKIVLIVLAILAIILIRIG